MQTMRVAVSGDDQLAKPVGLQDIQRHLIRHLGINVPIQQMHLPDTLSTIGNHKIPLRLTLDRRDSPVIQLKLIPKKN